MARLTLTLLALCGALAAVAADVCQTGTCLANGDSPCDRAAGACPPCMYAISGGYSCYGKIGDACPYPDTLTICSDKPAVTTRAPVATPARIPTAASATGAPPAPTPPPPAPTPPPPAPTPAPPATTATPVVTAAPATTAPPPATVAPLPTASAGTGVTAAPVETTQAPVETPTTDSSKADTTEASPGTKTGTALNPTTDGIGSVAPSKASELVAGPSTQSAPKATDPQNALAAESKSAPSKDSPKIVNVMIIVGVAFGALVVIAFVVRRMRERRNEPMNMGFDDLGFDKSPARQGGGQEFPMGGNQGFGDLGESGVYTTTQKMGGKIDFSTLEMEPVAGSARSKSQRRSSRPSAVPSAAPSSVMLNDNQSELEFSIGLNSSTQSHDQYQPQSAFNRERAKSRVRGIETSLIQNQYPELAGSYNSDLCSVMSADVDEFDIVDPGAIREGERRNTETLVADGRFRPLFSTASLADSSASLTDSFASSFVSNTASESHSEYSGNSVYI